MLVSLLLLGGTLAGYTWGTAVVVVLVIPEVLPDPVADNAAVDWGFDTGLVVVQGPADACIAAAVGAVAAAGAVPVGLGSDILSVVVQDLVAGGAVVAVGGVAVVAVPLHPVACPTYQIPDSIYQSHLYLYLYLSPWSSGSPLHLLPVVVVVVVLCPPLGLSCWGYASWC